VASDVYVKVSHVKYNELTRLKKVRFLKNFCLLIFIKKTKIEKKSTSYPTQRSRLPYVQDGRSRDDRPRCRLSIHDVRYVRRASARSRSDSSSLVHVTWTSIATVHVRLTEIGAGLGVTTKGRAIAGIAAAADRGSSIECDLDLITLSYNYVRTNQIAYEIILNETRGNKKNLDQVPYLFKTSRYFN
jgi:hypothetical protein